MHTLVVQQHLQHTSMGAGRILEVHATYVAAIPVNSESGTVSVTEGQFVCFRAQCPLLSAHYDRRSQSTQTSIPYLLVNWYGEPDGFPTRRPTPNNKTLFTIHLSESDRIGAPQAPFGGCGARARAEYFQPIYKQSLTGMSSVWWRAVAGIRQISAQSAGIAGSVMAPARPSHTQKGALLRGRSVVC